MGTHPIFESDFDCLTDKMAKKTKKAKKGTKKTKTPANRDSELAQALTNTKLWQHKLQLTERQRDDYRETCKKLAAQNEVITNALFQAERDTIEMVSVLKREDINKDKKIDELTHQLEKERKAAEATKETIASEFGAKSASIEKSLEEREKEIGLLQKELRNVKEFRRNKAQITEELRDLYNQLEIEKAANETNRTKMGQKFFIEKNKMEMEATKKIAQYAEKAQKEAIAAMSETTRKVFKDNVALSDAMKTHLERTEQLEVENAKLSKENKRLRNEVEINEATVKAKVIEARKAKDKILALRGRLNEANAHLTQVKARSEARTELVLANALENGNADRVEMHQMERQLVQRERDILRLKLLAKKVVDERTQMQQFFIEALDQVQAEIKEVRRDYVQRSKHNYNARMAAAARGQGQPPKVKTFATNGTTTNGIAADWAAAEEWGNVEGETDFGGLTWEQKEKVIRLLFAKMNGFESTKAKKSLPPIQKRPLSSKSSSNSAVALSEMESLHERAMSSQNDDHGGATFITQTV